MLATSSGSTSPAIAALAAASAAAWCGWPPGTSLIAMFVLMSRAAKDRGDRAVEPTLAATRGERLVDAPRDFVAEHHRREHAAAAGAAALGHRDRRRRDDRADVRDAAQVAVVRSGSVTHHRVHPRRVRDGQRAST